jgi:hypothetical protein
MKKVILNALVHFSLICVGFALPFAFVGVIDLLTLCSFSYVDCVRSVPFTLCAFLAGLPISIALMDDYIKSKK